MALEALETKKIKPLFMWAGGKTKLISRYENVFPKDFDTYVEPFFGAGAVFLWAYNKNPDTKFIINDLNKEIANIYTTIKEDCERFIFLMDSYSKSYLSQKKEDPIIKNINGKKEKEYRGRAKFYYELREKNAYDFEAWDTTERAAVTYFLMKTGFNGIWQVNKNTNNRFGTPPGLLNQKTEVYSKNTVLQWNKMLKNVTILSDDFSKVESFCNSGTFLYLDPPYRDSFTQYGYKFDDNEQNRVIDFFHEQKKKGVMVYLSNRDSGDQFFEKSCKDDNISYYDITYTAGRRKKDGDSYQAKKATELLIY